MGIKSPILDESFFKKLKNYYQGMPVLVTGGAGFIGSSLVESLVLLGADVTVFDNFSSGLRQNLSAVAGKIRLLEKDICDLCDSDQERAFVAKSAVVFHMAALSTVVACQERPDLCKKINYLATKNLIDKLSTKTRLVFSSTTATYGNCDFSVLEETPLRPTSCYADCKALSEREIAQRKGGSIILRYTNVVGPRARTDPQTSPVVSRFVKAIESGEFVKIFGTGSCTRDYVSVYKVVVANLAAAAFYKQALNFGFDLANQNLVFNVAEGQSTDLLGLLDRVESMLGKRAKGIEFLPARSFEVIKSEACSDRIDNFLSSMGCSERFEPMEFLRP